MDIMKKFTSRKFWMALAGLVVGILALFNVDGSTTTQISGVIMSLGSVIAYIIGEGLVDAAAANTNVIKSTWTDGSTINEITQPASGVISTVDSTAAEGTPTGVEQAAAVKQNTSLPNQ